jgi:hypothetical protein
MTEICAVLAIVVVTEPEVLPDTPGPVHAKLVGSPPDVQETRRVTLPPPAGRDGGDAVTAHPLGG